MSTDIPFLFFARVVKFSGKNRLWAGYETKGSDFFSLILVFSVPQIDRPPS